MPSALSNRRWCFTVNNYTPDDITVLESLPCKYIVFGKEVGVDRTPYLQGFVIFSGTKTLTALKKVHATAHWEITKKTSESAANYCKKGDQSKSEWNLHHDDGPNFGLNYSGFENGDFPSQQGKRNDLDAVKEAIQGGMTSLRDLRHHHSVAYSNNRRFVTEYALDFKQPVPQEVHPHKPWQEQLTSILDGPIDDPSIIFVVDTPRSISVSRKPKYF